MSQKLESGVVKFIYQELLNYLDRAIKLFAVCTVGSITLMGVLLNSLDLVSEGKKSIIVFFSGIVAIIGLISMGNCIKYFIRYNHKISELKNYGNISK